MLTSATVLIGVAVVVALLSVAAWRAVRRCQCQREAPLASLGALRLVTARARREQARGVHDPRPRGTRAPRPLRELRMTPQPPS